MTPEEKIRYKKLSFRIACEYEQMFDRGTGGQIRGKSPHRFNNKLSEMKEFLSSIKDGDYSKNRFMLAEPLEMRPKESTNSTTTKLK